MLRSLLHLSLDFRASVLEISSHWVAVLFLLPERLLDFRVDPFYRSLLVGRPETRPLTNLPPDCPWHADGGARRWKRPERTDGHFHRRPVSEAGGPAGEVQGETQARCERKQEPARRSHLREQFGNVEEA